MTNCKMRGFVRSLMAVAVCFAGVMSAGSSFGIETWMTGKELQETFNGVTVVGEYSSGRRFTELYATDNQLQYFEGPIETKGHWSVISGTFCTIYKGDLSGGCFRVWRKGSNCFEFYFVARTEDQVRRKREGRPGWTARGWIKDRADTCSEVPSV